MKKSRIIVPGMAVIAFSTAAAIAGSVAWFTASRTVTIKAGTYAVVKTTTNLEVELVDGCGTSANLNNDEITFTGKLTDGSFNHNSGKVYTPANSGKAITGEYAISGQTKAQQEEALKRATIGTGSSAQNVYTAATFGINFKLDFGNGDIASMKSIGLFFNKASSSIERADTSFTIKTATGFRVAFYAVEAPSDGVSEVVSRVYAGLQTANNCHYINGLTAANAEISTVTSDYDGDLIDSAYSTELPEAETLTKAQASARADYLGTFKPTAGVVTLKYTAVCWFEGTDPNVVNQEDVNWYETVVATLAFDAIDLAA